MTREEAIIIVQKNYPHVGFSGSQFETALRNLIPELRESENEKIRKELLSFIKSVRHSYLCATDRRKKWIAYLERQKEQKPSINIDQMKSMMLQYLQDAANKKDDSEIEAATNYWMEKLLGLTKWQKEPKPTPISCSHENGAEWSEDDIMMLKRCIAAIPEQGDEIMTTSYLNKLRNWLESLPEKFNFQPRQECSEEDDWKRNELIQYLEEKGDYRTVWMTWLKSLRSRPKSSDNWKPSEQEKGALRTAIHVLTEERNFPKAAAHLQAILDVFDKETRKEFKPNEEQMEALKWLVEYVAPSEKYIVSIKNLYDDLKKLM